MTQNRVEAYCCYNLAAAFGMYVDDLARRELAKNMSKEQILDAQRLSGETVSVRE